MRFLTSIDLVLVLGLAVLLPVRLPGEVEVTEEPGVLYKITGDQQGDGLGRSLVVIGDLDGDGAPDFVSGAPEHPLMPAEPKGYVRVFSGRTGATLRTFRNTAEERIYGTTIFAIGDRTGDGISEILMSVDRFVIVDPDTGELLSEIREEDGLSLSVRPAGGDYDGDGLEDVFLLNSIFDPENVPDEFRFFGRIALFSTKEHRTLWDRVGDHHESELGTTILVVRNEIPYRVRRAEIRWIDRLTRPHWQATVEVGLCCGS